MLRPPRLLHFGPAGRPLAQLGTTGGEDLAALLEDGERLLRIAPEVADRRGDVGSGGRQRLAVGRHLVLEALAPGPEGSLAHRRAPHDQRRPLRLGVGRHERLADFVDVVSVDRQHVPAPRLVLHGDVLGIHFVHLGRELHVVGVVIHDEITQPQMPGDAAHALRNLLFDRTVGDVGIGLVRRPLAETGRQETFRDGGAQRHGMPLSERTGGVFHAAEHVHFGVAGRHAAPLAQRLQVPSRIVPGQRQHRIEHRRHVSRIEEEPVAEGTGHVVGIVTQELRIEHRDEIRSAHGTSGMARLGLFDHRSRQDTDVVGDTGEFGICS